MDLALLPPHLLHALLVAVVFLLGACSVIGFASVVLGPVKRWMGDPTPADSEWKRRAFVWLEYADVIARNTPRVVDLLKMAQHELDLATKRRELMQKELDLAASNAALEQQHRTILHQENQIRVQAAVIKQSQRPPALDDEGVTPTRGKR